MTSCEKRMHDLKIWTKWMEGYLIRLNKEVESIEKEKREAMNEKRKQLMNSHNPKIVLRNHLAQYSIEKAEQGDFSEVRRLLRLLEKPYDEDLELDDASSKPLEFYLSRQKQGILRVSCSS